MTKEVSGRRWRVLDDDAFTRELKACESRTRRYIAAFVHDPDDAKDVYCETVETAYLKRMYFVIGGGSFGAWVRRIAAYKIAEHFRRQKSRLRAADLETSQDHQESLSQEDALVAQEDAAQLALELWKLPRKQQVVLQMHYGEGRPVAYIAAELKIDELAVRNRLVRGRRLLRKRLLKHKVYQALSEAGKRAVAEFLTCERGFGGQAVRDPQGEGEG